MYILYAEEKTEKHYICWVYTFQLFSIFSVFVNPNNGTSCRLIVENFPCCQIDSDTVLVQGKKRDKNPRKAARVLTSAVTRCCVTPAPQPGVNTTKTHTNKFRVGLGPQGIIACNWLGAGRANSPPVLVKSAATAAAVPEGSGFGRWRLSQAKGKMGFTIWCNSFGAFFNFKTNL